MASQPLFVSSAAVLRSKIRLSGVPAGTDAEAIIDDAILTVRSGFIRDLGVARTTYLQGLPFTESPATAEQVLRATANVTEVWWVKYELMGSLPMAFLDGGGSLNQAYHDEALYRHLSAPSELESQRIMLWDRIQENLDILRGTETVGEETTLNSATIGPDEGFVFGQSLNPWRRPCF